MTINMKTSIINLSDYDISRNGFLPAHPPISRLGTPYYEPWERTIDNLPAKIANQSVRHHVDSMPVLTTDKLRGKDEWRRAYVVLSFLMNAYIWSEGPPSERIPPPISCPLLTISKHLDLPPIATYAAFNLWNFSPAQTSSSNNSESKSYTNPDAIHATTTFTATPDEDWFYRISIAIESQAAPTIPLLVDALAAAERRDARTVERALSVFAEQVVRIGAILERVYEWCGAEVFYHRMRPFYVGTDMETAADGGVGLGKGVWYDTGEKDKEKEKEYVRLSGGSNAQSSLFQFFDIVLGVRHGGSTGEDYLTKMRSYMPGPHRRFLEDLEKGPSLRDFVTREPSDDALVRAFHHAVEQLAKLRSKHLQVVARYVVLPARKKARSSSAVTSVQKQGERRELHGTGGMPVMTFLKQVRDETVLAVGSG